MTTVSNATAASRFFRTFFELKTCHQHSRHHSTSNRLPSASCRPTTLRRAGVHTTSHIPRSKHTAATTFTSHPAAQDSVSQHPQPTQRKPDPPPEPLSTHLRHLMRVVPHPVTLITASLTSPLTSSRHTPPEHTFRGATVSSFNSVALHPVPLISLNMKLPSSTYDAMATSGTFLAHILAANTAGARIAGSFAKPGGAIDAFAGLALGVDGRKAECTVLTGPATGGAPMLGGTEGVLKVLRCRLCQGKEVRVGDHVVLIAEVVGVLSGSSEGGNGSGFNYMKAGKGSQEALHGLVYMDGAYRRVEIGGDLMEAGDVVEEETLKNREPVIRTMGMNIRRGDEHETERRS